MISCKAYLADKGPEAMATMMEVKQGVEGREEWSTAGERMETSPVFFPLPVKLDKLAFE